MVKYWPQQPNDAGTGLEKYRETKCIDCGFLEA